MDKATELMRSCEHSLRDLASQTVQAGDYTTLRRLTDWAETIKTLTGNALEMPKTSPASKRPRVVAGKYPRFFRSKDDLVKVGWSKKAKKEYHHYAPRSVVEALATKVKVVGVGGKIFTSDDLLPLKDDSVGTDFPGYQVYLALAWLRHLGMVDQHGRRGAYVLQASESIDSIIATAWGELEQWEG